MAEDLTPEEIKDLFGELFTGKSSTHGRYTCVGDIEEVIKGRVVTAVLRNRDREDELRNVTLFLNIGGAGGELWEHEVRSLLRLKLLGHPALPEIMDGRFDSTRRVAFIMTRHEGKPLHKEWQTVTREWAKAYPLSAFEQFSLLVDALSQLHGTRITHRNLTLGAIRVNPMPDRPARASFTLSRFELSALLNNLLHSVHGPGAKARYDQFVRELFLTEPPGVSKAHHLAYLPPERHPSVFLDIWLRHLDHGSTDVFGLGVLGWELFVGALVDVLPAECAVVEDAEREDLPSALADLHRAMRRHLDLSTILPRPLREALGEMLDPSPSARCSSFEASGKLQEHWTEICTFLDPAPDDDRPKLLAFMPEQSEGTIHQVRGWTDHSPKTKQGCDELQAFLENELREAEMVYSHGGATSFVEGEHKSTSQAKWVLIGEQAVWFCAFLYEETLMGRRTSTDEKKALVIKYVVNKRFAAEILSIRPKRRMGKIDLVPFRIGQPLDDKLKDRPSWENLTNAVTTDLRNEDVEVQEMLRATEFMLEYQGAVHRARQYPFIRRTTDDGRVMLTVDKDRELNWLHGDALLTAYSSNPRRRPPLGDFAVQLLAEDEPVWFTVTGDRPSPYFGGDTSRIRLADRLDADSVTIETSYNQGSIPERGWLRPEGDRGTQVQLRREARGLESLRQKPGLARILHTPASIELRSHQDTVLRIPAPPGAKPLRGKASDIIADMLRLHPFYALQGPPGTGKSTVVAHALRDFLSSEHGARVLVSAQSNDALEQLAVKLVELLKPAMADQSVLVLQELSRARDPEKLPKPLRRLTAELITDDLVQGIEKKVEDGCLDARNPDEENLMRQWAALAKKDMVELAERVRAGADIVLATCSIAGSLTDEAREPSDVFDWVIIEEAAKAWPTEIIMPLVLGVRWTLVGDHLQLGPHRAQDVATFLEGLVGHKDKRVALHYSARESYLSFVQLFGRFFKEEPDDTTNAKKHVNTLDTQFRMHPDIAQPFARTFYSLDGPPLPDGFADAGPQLIRHSGTFLNSDLEIDEVHGRSEPPYVRDAPLVWLDTSTREDCADLGHWWNPGEVALVEELVTKLGLATSKNAKDLVVLTPYRRQVSELERGFLKGRVHTVHSFQGGQAKTAIVSLVRSRQRGADPRQNIGHTGQPDVINVMLSRAQQLLVVVGDMAHFEAHGGKDWAKVIEVFREVGTIVDAEDGTIVNAATGSVVEAATGSLADIATGEVR